MSLANAATLLNPDLERENRMFTDIKVDSTRFGLVDVKETP